MYLEKSNVPENQIPFTFLYFIKDPVYYKQQQQQQRLPPHKKNVKWEIPFWVRLLALNLNFH